MGNPTTQDWVRLEVLILRRACNLLRKQFLKRWKLTQKSEWANSPEHGTLFVNGLGSQIYQGCGRLHKMTLKEGDIYNWDFSILSRILQQVDFLPKVEEGSTNLREEFAKENKRLEELISHSKKAIDHPTKVMEDVTYSQLWDQIEQILVSFGENEKELEELKRTVSVSEDDLLSLSGEESHHPIDEFCVEKAKKLKEDAKNLVNSGDVDGAITVLKEAIALSKVLPDLELGALYATRSDAYLRKAVMTRAGSEERMDGAYLALKDAKQAMFLRPAWGLAHYRVGMAYVELGKFRKASKYLDQALDLEPNVEEIRVANNTCKIKIGQVSDDFAPNFKPFERTDSLPKESPPTPLPGGTRYSPEVMDKLDLIFFADDKDNLMGEIYRAHKLRDGIHTKQNYRDAALLYRKGVKSRNAEAMYNLALLKLEGHGVKQDVKGAIDLLKKASKQPNSLYNGNGFSFTSNVGVVESSFVLAILAAEGIGFPPQKDYFSASVYYLEASEHGHGPSSNNLAILFSKGQGVARNEKRALQLWKLAAARKVPEAMFGLAIHHAKEWETSEARKWFELAIMEYEANSGTGCQLHNDLLTSEDEGEGDHKKVDVDTAWTPTPTLVQEFTTVLNVIDHWRARYGQKEIARWETATGHKSPNQNLTMKYRLSRYLQEVETEKEKISAIEDYFQHLSTSPVIIPFNNAKQWAAEVRQGMFIGVGNNSEGEDSRNNSQNRSVSSTSSFNSDDSVYTN